MCNRVIWRLQLATSADVCRACQGNPVGTELLYMLQCRLGYLLGYAHIDLRHTYTHWHTTKSLFLLIILIDKKT